MRFVKLGVIVIGILFLASGCETYKNIPYFKDFPDSSRANILNSKYRQLTIQPDDILNINIQNIDPNSNNVFNQGVQSSLSSIPPMNTPVGLPSNNQGISGSLVDKNGYVVLPMIGKVKLDGLTTDQARDTIEAHALIYYKMPTVNVRFANLKITVLGEVLRPGTYILPNEKNTIFDALGLAGDLTIYGKRENLLLIRDSGSNSNLIRFSLNSKNLLQQDFFYLKQNDVIYVEPAKSKIASLDANKTRNYTIAASVLSVLVILATRVR